MIFRWALEQNSHSHILGHIFQHSQKLFVGCLRSQMCENMLTRQWGKVRAPASFSPSFTDTPLSASQSGGGRALQRVWFLRATFFKLSQSEPSGWTFYERHESVNQGLKKCFQLKTKERKKFTFVCKIWEVELLCDREVATTKLWKNWLKIKYIYIHFNKLRIF